MTGCAITGPWRKAATRRPPPGPRPAVVLADPSRPGPATDRLSLGRLAHLRAIAAVRLSLESGPTWAEGHAHWRSERKIRHASWTPSTSRASSPPQPAHPRRRYHPLHRRRHGRPHHRQPPGARGRPPVSDLSSLPFPHDIAHDGKRSPRRRGEPGASRRPAVKGGRGRPGRCGRRRCRPRP
jgi:hypothetical protein